MFSFRRFVKSFFSLFLCRTRRLNFDAAIWSWIRNNNDNLYNNILSDTTWTFCGVWLSLSMGLRSDASMLFPSRLLFIGASRDYTCVWYWWMFLRPRLCFLPIKTKGDAKQKKKTTWNSLGFELRAAFLRSFLLNI